MRIHGKLLALSFLLIVAGGLYNFFPLIGLGLVLFLASFIPSRQRPIQTKTEPQRTFPERIGRPQTAKVESIATPSPHAEHRTEPPAEHRTEHVVLKPLFPSQILPTLNPLQQVKEQETKAGSKDEGAAELIEMLLLMGLIRILSRKR